ncbi:MAG TPA: hypothetical protein PKH79_01175 [Prolixibacteraceae bacterium]|nr:hypothetical protein [Prolixibacteraceae bacterium]
MERHISSSSKSGKKHLLFKLLRDGNKKNEEELSKAIFGKVSPTNLKKLEDRLLLDIEDAILLNYGKFKTSTNYDLDKSNTITQLLLAQYYLQNGLYPEAYKKMRKSKKIIDHHNFIFLESIYYQLYCDYLSCTGNKEIEKNLIDSLRVLSELQFIQSIRLNGLKPRSTDLMIENNLLPVINNDTRQGDYTKCLTKLTQLKHLIDTGKTEKANTIYNSMITDSECWLDKIPTEMYVEILLQKVKINIADGAFKENLTLIDHIKNLDINSKNSFYEYLRLRFINYFALGLYDVCKNISFFFFSDKKEKGNISESITSQWFYFNICLAFIKEQYTTALKMILQFPRFTGTNNILHINIRIIEIYLSLIENRNHSVDSKIQSVKQIVTQTEMARKNRYGYLIDKLENYKEENHSFSLTAERNKTSTINKAQDGVPKQDFLGMELIPFEMFEAVMKSKIKRMQATY